MNRRKFLCLAATGAAAAAIAPALPASPPETPSYDEFLDYLNESAASALNLDVREFSENSLVTLYPGTAFQLSTFYSRLGHPKNL